jgi:hypothetical protein
MIKDMVKKVPYQVEVISPKGRKHIHMGNYMAFDGNDAIRMCRAEHPELRAKWSKGYFFQATRAFSVH